MNTNWRSFLQSAKGVFDGESAELINFGNPAAELQAANEGTVLVPLCHLGLIEANGEDAKSFLHSQFTNDVNHLGESQVQHAGWCTAKGRMQASFLLWRDDAGFQMTLSADLQEAGQKRLQMFILRSKVKLVSHTETKIMLGLSGKNTEAALSAAGLPCPAEVMTSATTAEATVLRIEPTRFIIIAPLEAATVLWGKLSLEALPAGIPVWRWLDVQSAFPLVTLATKEEFVPQMADFEKIGGVSFHKGCYPGQEIVARTQYLGKVKRHLYRVTSEQPVNAGDTLFSPENLDQACGMIMTGAPSPLGGYAALAVIQSNYANNVHLDSREGPSIQTAAVNP